MPSRAASDCGAKHTQFSRGAVMGGRGLSQAGAGPAGPTKAATSPSGGRASASNRVKGRQGSKRGPRRFTRPGHKHAETGG
jgi:hypothetical protein